MHESRPRIGIMGTGAIGGFYGAMLAQAGFDVHFLLRSEFEAVREHGLRVNSVPRGVLHLRKVQAYRDVADMPPCDWLLVGAKTTSNSSLAPAIVQAAAAGAKVVLLQNGIAVEDAMRPLLPDTLHLLGGLCFICVHREAPGVVEHQSQGAISLGYHSGPALGPDRQALIDEGVAMFREAGLDSHAAASLEQARWQKLVWNAPYNGLAVLLQADTRALMDNPDSVALVESIMREVVSVARAAGHALPEGLVEKMLKTTRHMPDYLPSMYHDHAQGRPMELEAIYASPLAAAARLGVEMPRTEALFRALRFIAARQSA
ncbi:putative 2-dehydropantoate 2-reductase [Stutzerimonas kirkiae]|uniref:putative 2-dehydropantoate 2-reductase n=1 Tax=Stutzerimonas kirkiae TaxID=2211392 RepID=UPI0010383AFE|nr:putative 2-dehydropantoate 2-reductase [Stutzerimonas kirkiae]TBV11800.1 putative 2-dehydropantoate 2-reductase [Stutzerimonas kirkiae]